MEEETQIGDSEEKRPLIYIDKDGKHLFQQWNNLIWQSCKSILLAEGLDAGSSFLNFRGRETQLHLSKSKCQMPKLSGKVQCSSPSLNFWALEIERTLLSLVRTRFCLSYPISLSLLAGFYFRCISIETSKEESKAKMMCFLRHLRVIINQDLFQHHR